MDPLSLITAVASILTSLQDKYDTYAKQQDTKQDSLMGFRKAASRLQDDLRMYNKFIQDIYEQPAHAGFFDNKSLLPSLSAFKKSLADAEDRYRDLLSNHTSNTIASDTGRGKSSKGLVLPLVFPNQLATSIKRIDTATHNLISDADAIERSFKALFASYILYEIPTRRLTPTTSLTTPITDHSARAKAIDDVVSSFFRNPFNLSARSHSANVLVESLYKLNQDRDIAERVTKEMRAQGASWVETSGSSDTVEGLGQIQARLMELLWAVCIPQIDSRELKFAKCTEDESRDLTELSLGLKSAIVRGKSQKFSIAFCGMVKAGKSLFLNALMGRSVLPSDELPSTAWPCRLRHVPQQSVPRLAIDPKPFEIGIAKLREHKFGSKMKSYQPPTDDPFADLFDGSVPNSTQCEDLIRIYSHWKSLSKQTCENLLRFEDPEYELLSCAEGEVHVAELLGQLNDVVRLCHRFGLGFSSDSEEWPLLSVEFESLRDRHVDGIFEFIDIPGLGEDFDTFSFEELITRIAAEANAVVPIVSFKEIAKADWRVLPRIISSGLQTRASLVICTHFDQISKNNLEAQRSTVAQAFWPGQSLATDRVIPCSSKMGLSATTLRRLSAKQLPTFERIFDPNRIEYPCAATILGQGQPEDTYHAMSRSPHVWQAAVERQWHNSGLPDALRRLTSDMVEQAKQRVLVSEGRQLYKQIRKINTGQQRVLLEMRRSKDELEKAREEFQGARAEFTNTLNTWSREEQRQDVIYKEKLALSVQRLQDIGRQCVDRALQATTNMSTKIRDPTTSAVFVGSKQEAEEFLRDSQQRLTILLLDLKHKFVATVRDLAERANRDRIERLRDAIRAFKGDMEAELRSDILLDLEALTISVRALAFHSIQKGLKTERVRYSPGEIYRIMEGALAKPLLALQDDIVDDMTPEVTIKDMGLLVRAPVAIIATIPFLLSAGVWMFVTKAKNYHCQLSVLAKAYQDQIVTTFLRDLEKESSRSLKSALAQSSNVAKTVVELALQREDARYERESKEKDKPPSQEEVAELLASHLNFVAAEGAFAELTGRLEKFVTYQ